MKKKILACLLAVFVFFATGCDKKETEDTPMTVAGSMIDIYYPQENNIIKSKEQYQLKQPDSVSASVEEIMTVLMTKLDEEMTYSTYMLDSKNNLTLNFQFLEEYSAEYKLLATAAITKTLFQVEDINGIQITITDSQGKVLSDNFYLRESFYFYDYEENEDLNEVKVTVYHGNGSMNKLVSEETVLIQQANTTIEEEVVKYLISINAIPSDTSINGIYINTGICYVDLSQDYIDKTNDYYDIVIYAVVNSVSKASKASKIQILIDGDKISNYLKTDIYDQPLMFNNEILK